MSRTKRSKTANRNDEFSRGWFIVLGASIGVAVGVSSLPYYTLGTFITELENEFGWTRSGLSTGIMLWTIGLAIAAPIVGQIVDQYGVKLPAIISLISVAICFLLMGFVMTAYWQFLMFLLFLSVFGAASSPVSFTRAVNEWFSKARGLALGITLMGSGVTATFVPRLLAEIIEHYGWRGGYVFLSLLIIVAIPLVWILIRNRPVEENAPCSTLDTSTEPTPPRILRSKLFWALTTVFFLLAIPISGLLVHFIPLLEGNGYDKATAASLAGFIGIAVIIGRIVVGLLIDRFFAPFVAAIVFMICAGGCTILLLATGNPGAVAVSAFAIGFSMGAEVDLIGYLTARYFGMEFYGQIYGYQYSAFVIGVGLGPALIGMAYDQTGGYTLALVASVCLLLAVCVLLVQLPAYRHAE